MIIKKQLINIVTKPYFINLFCTYPISKKVLRFLSLRGLYFFKLDAYWFLQSRLNAGRLIGLNLIRVFLINVKLKETCLPLHLFNLTILYLKKKLWNLNI